MKELNKYLKEKFIVFKVNVFIVNIQNPNKYLNIMNNKN